MEEKESNLDANRGRGLLIKVFTPACDKKDWEELYWDKTQWDGLDKAAFQFNWPIGELIFENDDILTHESVIEQTKEKLEAGWIELPASYGDMPLK